MAEENQTPGFEEEKEPSSMRLIMTLGVAGFLSGLILVGAFLYTKPLIARNKAQALEKAIYQVLPQATSYKTLELKDGKVQEVKEDNSKKNQRGEEPPRVYMGFNDQHEMVGFAVPAAGPGFQDIISSIFGYNAKNRTIIGFQVLDSKETPGLGDKIVSDADFHANFNKLAVEPEIDVVKKGEKTKPNQVQAITGATISSTAVVKLLNKAVDQWKKPIADYLRTHSLKMAPAEASTFSAKGSQK